MWKLKDFAEGKTRDENARILKSRLEALVGVIPEIRSLEAGINMNPADAAYDVVVFSEFDNLESLKIYQQHPAHQALITECLNAIRISKAFVDYEST